MRPGLIRIIAGKWRSRRLVVPESKDLRPTPDRVRETLFNWLAPMIEGATCLDLFAGSGVLAFEALSRGARFVMMIDQSPDVVALLKKEIRDFQAENAMVYCARVPEQLSKYQKEFDQDKLDQKKFDIVFLDPPYQANILLPCCHYLENNGFLADSAYIYLEARQVIEDNELPSNWRLIKSKRAGQVFYHLAHREKKKIEK